jgi:type I restriction enzyme, S subunit
MSWKKVKLGQFLINREGRYKPNDIAIKGLKRIDKIDFSGKIHISDKPSNTDMILIKNGDLVISGINVEKGAMTIYQGEEDVVATIHYSSYEFDENKIDIAFLKSFLKSIEFKNALKEQVPGGIKTEIKPKHLLPLLVKIPTDITEQRKVVNILESRNSKVDAISTELTHQFDLVKKLRQQLLKDAVQGKLVEQNKNDEPASELLKKIKAEKQKLISEKKLKKEKELSSIKPEEIPFEIPENWVWCRFENLCSHIFDMEHKMPNAVSNGGVMFLSAKDLIDKGKINYTDNVKHISEDDYNYLTRNFKPQKYDIIYSRRGANLGKSRIVDTDIKYLASYSCCTIRTLNPCLEYINYLLDGGFILQQATKHTTNNSIPDLGVNKIKSFIVPLPPLSEQKRIVNKINELIQYCDDLEASIKQSQQQNEKLLQQVLREALRGESVEN